MSTEYLQEKINHLKNQIRQGDMEIFNHTLMVEDAKTILGDKKIDATFANQAAQSKAHIMMWEHKNSSRRALLQKLEAEQASQLVPANTGE